MLEATQFQAANNTEGDDLVVGSEDKVGYEDLSSNSDLLIAQLQFDATQGILTLIKKGGDVITTSGFMITAQVGKGPVGRRGRRGKAGRDGRDGKDGSTGTSGCTGPDGLTGADGPTGNAGPDGAKGLDGIYGERGNKGGRGDQGPIGTTGPDGVIGATGMSCLRGPTGATGPTPAATCIFSDTIPTDQSYFAWCTPAYRGQARPVIQKFQELNLVLTRPTVTSKRFNSTLIFVADFYIKANASGGSGNYQYNWSYPTVPNTVFTPNGKQLHVRVVTTAAASERLTQTHNVSLTLYDVGQTVKPSLTTSTSYTVNTVG
jgi:hypothetical protein